MNSSCQTFIESIGKISIGAKAVRDDMVMEWQPEEPPPTILLGGIGYRIAEDFDRSDPQTNRAIFAVVEEGMNSPDAMVSTAVATGLIEGIVTRTDEIDGLWDRIASCMGPESSAYAEAWMRF